MRSENSSPTASSSKVTLPIEGNSVDFSAILLRDACACPSCVHPSTNQRLFSTADIPSDITAKSVEVDAANNTVAVTWTNDAPGFPESHKTDLNLATLTQFSKTGTPTASMTEFPSQALWTAKRLELPDYDYNTYLEDDSMLHDVIKQLRVHGLAFVNNIPGLESSLATIATRMGPIKDTFYGYTWDGMLASLDE